MSHLAEIAEAWMWLHKWMTISDERQVRMRTIDGTLYVSLYQDDRAINAAISEYQIRKEPKALLLEIQRKARELGRATEGIVEQQKQ